MDSMLIQCENGVERGVCILHRQGLAPSQIDEKMKLDKGTAHDIVVMLWAKQKARSVDRPW